MPAAGRIPHAPPTRCLVRSSYDLRLPPSLPPFYIHLPDNQVAQVMHGSGGSQMVPVRGRYCTVQVQVLRATDVGSQGECDCDPRRVRRSRAYDARLQECRRAAVEDRPASPQARLRRLLPGVAAPLS